MITLSTFPNDTAGYALFVDGEQVRGRLAGVGCKSRMLWAAVFMGECVAHAGRHWRAPSCTRVRSPARHLRRWLR